MNKIELLSPAGDYNCFVAAINAGADAVYLSGEKFGARAYAKNFSKEELIAAIDYAHLFNSKVYLTVNTLLKDNEMEELYDYILPFYEAGLDGTIVQDMGVISFLRRNFSDLPVHVSTQLAITGLEGIKLLENEGVERVVLAREVSLEEIKYIKEHSSMEIETFVHGALCYSYSGKCLFSSLAGGRSGNRGRCAGSCRQPYNDQYLLSTKDICGLSILPDLIDAGIESLKIEGRMKSPEYVALVTATYRKYIDIYYDNVQKMTLSEIKSKFFETKELINDIELLTKLYSRGGNSTGYYYKHNGKDMITLLDASYKSDKGQIKESKNDQLLSSTKRIKINGTISIHKNEEMILTINDLVSVKGAVALEAENRPIDRASVFKQLNKTKDTEFEFELINYDIAEDVFVRLSDINELRRTALSKYKETLLKEYRRKVFSNKANAIDSLNNTISEYTYNSPLVACEINNVDQLNIIKNYNIVNRVYIPISLLLDSNRDIINELKKNGKEVFIKFQSVIRYNFLSNNKIKKMLMLADGVLADSHEVIYYLVDMGFDKPIIGDIHIYALNREASNKYRSLGVSALTVPIELSKKELYRRNIKGEELILYGYLPMMISAQCINKTINRCDKNKKIIKLKDRKGLIFTAINNCSDCSNIIYNNVPLSLHGELDIINNIKPSAVRLIFTFEDTTNTKEIMDFYTKIIESRYVNSEFNCPLAQNKYTKGHLKRGVL